MSRGNTFTYPETTEKTITTQHQNEAYLLLDTNDRFTLTNEGYVGNASNNNFLINHQKLNGFGELKKIAVTEYVFPWVTPNVNVRNQYFFLEISTGTVVYIKVPEDWYTPIELAAQMTIQLNSNLYTNFPNNTPYVGQTLSTTPLVTYAVTTFLINGPVYNTPYTTALNYYVNCDAIGGTLNANGSVSGNQTYGSFYAKTAGTIPTGFPAPSPWDGLCLSDIDGSNMGARSYAYLNPLRTATSKVLCSFGGYYADVRGLFASASYTIPGYPGGSQPRGAKVIEAFCNAFLGITTAPNTLGWSNAEWGGVRFDGLNLDFENIGQGGNPNTSNSYPPIPATPPTFPANATDPQYLDYVNEIVLLIKAYHFYAPTKILTHAPLSLAINGDGSTKNCAITTALNTWFAFTNSTTAPTVGSYNNTASLAMNHPAQLAYFDDIFIQAYNAISSDYVGGVNFPTILAQWGFVALKAQQLGIKSPKINIGLAKGTIQGSTSNPSVASSQGPTAPLSPTAPYTYWYPQWETASPPNPDGTLPAGNTYPNIGVSVDATNLTNALNTANTLLRSSGLPNAAQINISDWCSGAGFWAGNQATTACKDIFTKVLNLPQSITYTWADAQYPAPDPGWAGNVPIIPTPGPPGPTTPWTVSTNAKTNVFTVANTGIQFNSTSLIDEVLNTVVGINRITSVNYTNTLTGGIPSMAYTTYIDVCSNALTKFQTLKDTLTQFNYTNIITRIYLQDAMNQPNTYFGSRPAVINRQITDPKYMKWNVDQMVPGIDIQLRDDSGNLLYIPEISSESTTNASIFTLKLVEDN